ncbi:MAG: hypothetical protein LW850_12835 [Planctomycetaceae bacterium]|nr:hypothetical protein [Planctomycetaceae bacterium]
MTTVWLMGASRTPIGRFLGDLSMFTAPALAGVSIRRTIERTGIEPDSIQELFVGNVVSAGVGQAPAKQASRKGALPDSVSCTMVNKVCGSGLQATILAARTIQSGAASACIAAGMESMSQAPHVLMQSRTGTKYGTVPMLDSIDIDGLRCSLGSVAMGTYAEKVAKEQPVSRADQDAWALTSHKRAFASQTVACVRQLNISPDQVNVHGGAIALGHPIGCSGTRILVTLMHAMQRHQKRLGIASLCIGGGEAVAVLIEQDPKS